jgi:hypothetical protein
MPAEKDMGWPGSRRGRDKNLFQGCHGVLQSFAVVRGIARPGRPPGSHLPKWQIATQHGESGGAESLRQCDQQRSMRIPAGAMSQHQAVMVGLVGNMESSANVRFDGVVGERMGRWTGQETILMLSARGEMENW